MRFEKKSPLKSEKKPPSKSHKKGALGYNKKTALLEEAITHMNLGKYGRSSAALKELLALDPLNTEARRLFATLHLRLGSLISARTAFEALAREALQRQDFWLAESLLREYLTAGPRCVPFLEMLGQVYEEKGDLMAAVGEYGKAIDVLIEDPDPEQPGRAAEIFAKIRSLAAHSPVALRLAGLFDPNTGAFVPSAAARETPTDGNGCTASESQMIEQSGEMVVPVPAVPLDASAPVAEPEADICPTSLNGDASLPVKEHAGCPEDTQPVGPVPSGEDALPRPASEPEMPHTDQPFRLMADTQAEAILDGTTGQISTPEMPSESSEVPEVPSAEQDKASLTPTLTQPDLSLQAVTEPIAESAPIPSPMPWEHTPEAALSIPKTAEVDLMTVESKSENAPASEVAADECVPVEGTPASSMSWDEILAAIGSSTPAPSVIADSSTLSSSVSSDEAGSPHAAPLDDVPIPIQAHEEVQPMGEEPAGTEDLPLSPSEESKPAWLMEHEDSAGDSTAIMPEALSPPVSDPIMEEPKYESSTLNTETYNLSIKQESCGDTSTSRTELEVSGCSGEELSAGASAAEQATTISEELGVGGAEPLIQAEPADDCLQRPNLERPEPPLDVKTLQAEAGPAERTVQFTYAVHHRIDDAPGSDVAEPALPIPTTGQNLCSLSGEADLDIAQEAVPSPAAHQQMPSYSTPPLDAGRPVDGSVSPQHSEAVNLRDVDTPADEPVKKESHDELSSNRLTRWLRRSKAPKPPAGIVVDTPGADACLSTVTQLNDIRNGMAGTSEDYSPIPSQPHQPFSYSLPSTVLHAAARAIGACFSTTRSIVATLVAAGLAGCLLAAICVGAAALAWLSMEERPSSTYLDLTRVPTRATEDPSTNGYLFLLEFERPAVSEVVQAALPRKVEASDVKAMAACLTEPQGPTRLHQLDGEAVFTAWQNAGDPAVRFRAQSASVKSLAEQAAASLARYKQWLKMPFDDWGYGEPISPNCALILRTHRLYVAEGFAQGLEAGIDRLEVDLGMWRQVMGHAKSLGMKALAVWAVTDDVHVLTGLLGRPDIEEKFLGRLGKLSRPLDQAEQSLRWPMQSELTMAGKIQTMLLKQGMAENQPWYAPLMSRMPLPQQKRLNDYAAYYEAAWKAASESRCVDLPKRADFVHAPAQNWIDYGLNPIENLLGVPPLPAWDIYCGRVLEVEARLRLAGLQAWLKRGPPERDLIARMVKAGHALYDPFTGFPMLVNRSKGVLYSVGIDGRDNDGDSSLDVTAQLPFMPAAANTDGKSNAYVLKSR